MLLAPRPLLLAPRPLLLAPRSLLLAPRPLLLIILFLPIAILTIAAREVLNFAIPLEDQRVVNHSVHEVAIVTDDDEASTEVLQIILEYLQRHDVEVIRRLVEDEEVGRFHQHCAEIKPASLTTTQFIDVAVLFFWRKKEMLQKLTGRQFLSVAHIHILCNVSDGINHLLVIPEGHPLLGVVAETDGLANRDTTTVMGFYAKQHLHKRRFACTVIAYDAELLVTCKIIVEILEDDVLSKGLAHVLRFKDFVADVRAIHLQPYIPFFDALLGTLLQFVEGFNPVTGFRGTGTGSAAHPFQLCSI